MNCFNYFESTRTGGVAGYVFYKPVSFQQTTLLFTPSILKMIVITQEEAYNPVT